MSLLFVSILNSVIKLLKLVITAVNISQMQTVMEDLFSVSCPKSLTDPSGAKFTEDFESLSGWSGTYRGSVINNKYPMCGRKSLLNPGYIINRPHTQTVTVSSNPYVSVCIYE